jgi:hypothetical protein
MAGELEVKISADRKILALDCPVCKIPVAKFELGTPKTDLLRDN